MSMTLVDALTRVNTTNSFFGQNNQPALPCNLQVEQALLGALLYAPDELHNCAELKPTDFFWPEHIQLFAAIQALAETGRRATPVTIAPYLTDLPRHINPPQYLGKLLADVTSILNVADYAFSIREYAARRRLVEIGGAIIDSARAMNESPATLAGDAIQNLDEVVSTARAKRSQAMSLYEAGMSGLRAFEEKRGKFGVKTGLLDLDRPLGGGFPRPELIVMGARPSMGKTAFAMCTSRRAAAAGYPVLFFSLEMTKEILAARAVSDMIWNQTTPIPYESIIRWDAAAQSDKIRLYDAFERYRDLPIMIDDQPGLCMAEIAARSRQHAARLDRAATPLAMIVVDHLGKVRASDRYAGQSVLELAEKTNGLFNLSKELNISVLALHQLNRNVEGRDNRRPELPDLRGGGSIEEDAGVVGFLYRPAYYLERAKFDSPTDAEDNLRKLEAAKNTLEISLAKNRNGPCCVVEAFCDIANNVIRDKVR